MATTIGTSLGSRGGHLVFLIAFSFHALLLSSQVATERGHSAFRALLLGTMSPFQRGADAVLGGAGSAWNNYVDLRGVRAENDVLRDKVARLEQALWLERDVVASYRRLSEELQLAGPFPYEPITAEVIGIDTSAWARSLIVNQGTERGVELNAPVVGARGLIGRVISVGRRVAQVQLLTDRDCSVGALLSRTRTRGVIAGTGDQASPTGLGLRYVANLEDVVEGDPIVTSGSDGLYHKGIAIGRVASVRNGPHLFKMITVEPAAELDRLEEVFILPAVPEPDITDRVE